MVTNIWVAFSCYNRRTSPCVIHGALLVHSIHPCHTLASHDDDRLPAASKTKTKSKSLVHSTVPRPFRKGCPAGRTAPRPVSGSAASASGAGGRCRRCRRAPGPVSSLRARASVILRAATGRWHWTEHLLLARPGSLTYPKGTFRHRVRQDTCVWFVRDFVWIKSWHVPSRDLAIDHWPHHHLRLARLQTAAMEEITQTAAMEEITIRPVAGARSMVAEMLVPRSTVRSATSGRCAARHGCT